MATSMAALFFPALTRNPNTPFPPKNFQEPIRTLTLSLSREFDGRRSKWRGLGSLKVKRKAKEEQGDDAFSALEAEVLDFMERSENPNAFPTKQALIAAGRSDLAEAIASSGGWLAFGWDSDEPGSSGSTERAGGEESGIEGILSRLERERSLSFGLGSNGGHKNEEVLTRKIYRDDAGTDSSDGSTSSDFGTFHQSAQVGFQNYTAEDVNGNNMWRTWSLERTGNPVTEFEAAEIVPGEDRIKLDINITNDAKMSSEPQSISEIDDRRLDQSCDAKESDQNQLQRHLLHLESELSSSLHLIRSRADGGISHKQIGSDDSVDVKVSREAQSISKTGDRRLERSYDAKQSGQNQLQMRLRHLESELSSFLHLLRSRTNGGINHKGQVMSLDELHRLSDAWEFKETEIMRARDQLRSTRAKLAVLEGKMALEIIEAQKIMGEKRKRLDAAKKALCLLCSACIVWPNPASEVLLVGSFDGWTSQRKMERSDTGMFSLQLKLYPGCYEIKFIVDGVWRIDPLRPVVHNNGHENNLLMVS